MCAYEVLARRFLLPKNATIFERSCRTGSRSRKRERKVRSPQGGVPANGRGSRKGLRKVPQKIYRPATLVQGGRVRVKWCGKSAPHREQSRWQGKPHAEQDQIGEEGRPVPLDFRVGR